MFEVLFAADGQKEMFFNPETDATIVLNIEGVVFAICFFKNGDMTISVNNEIIHDGVIADLLTLSLKGRDILERAKNLNTMVQ